MMIKKILSLALMFLTLNLAFYSTAQAQTNPDKDAALAAKIKTDITRHGTGKFSKVKLKLKDGRKLQGHVSEIKETGFVLTEKDTGATSEISFAEVKSTGRGLSKTGSRVLAIAAVAGALYVLSNGAARGN